MLEFHDGCLDFQATDHIRREHLDVTINYSYTASSHCITQYGVC